MTEVFTLSYIHPSLWFIAEGPRDSTMGIPSFDNRLGDEWTANLHKPKILGYVGVYVDDLLIASPRSLNDTLIRAVQGIWKTSAPEHPGPDQLILKEDHIEPLLCASGP